jgi:hypothetical protein
MYQIGIITMVELKAVTGLKEAYKDVLHFVKEVYTSVSHIGDVYENNKHQNFYEKAFKAGLEKLDLPEKDKEAFLAVNNRIMKNHGYGNISIASVIHSARDTADYLYKVYLDKEYPVNTIDSKDYDHLAGLSEKFSTLAKHSMIEAIVECRKQKADPNITQTDDHQNVSSSRRGIDSSRAT